MVQIDVIYEGELHTTAIHGPSGARLSTDAPVDNQGRGEEFSPTDLVATALGTCVLTLMGIYARRHGLDIAGTRVRVEKHMNAEPRRIGRLPIIVDVSRAIEARHRQGIEAMANGCPVKASLHPEIDTTMVFRYPAAT